VRAYQLANKRALGWLNLRVRRAKTHRLDVLEGLLAGLSEERADLHVVTGDLTSLALPDEMADARALLDRFGLTPDNTVLVPGNHDRYTIAADLSSAFERCFREFTGEPRGRERPYPIFRAVGPVALAALDTAVWRGPIRAAGRIDAGQVDRLVALLDGEGAAGRWPIIAMHHPPFELEGELLRQYRVGLEGRELLDRALAGRTGTILHGHIHELSRRRLGGFDVIGAPSASNDAGDAARQAAYNVYAFDRAGLLDGTIVRYTPDGRGGGKREKLPLPTAARVS
jgi:3',5'-cyclic AMP phosphodiesterase CpdA